MFKYQIIFGDNSPTYTSTSVFCTRREAKEGGVDFIRRYKATFPKAICSCQIVGV